MNLPEPTPSVADGERTRRWAATMGGHRLSADDETDAGDDLDTMAGRHGAVRAAHAGGTLRIGPAATDDAAAAPADRRAREEAEHAWLVAGATRAEGAGHRAREEQPDPERTCFERDRDRILHSPAFRRLAGKTQVFIFPDDHQRTRLTHALEVAQVAVAIARALRLNVALTEAIALGHDCGHGPGGHASEDALSPYVSEGYDHAVWGADEVLCSLNLCEETLDGVRNHSWSRPRPATPEGLVVSWADRIAYTAHDFEDAVSAGIVDHGSLPPEVAAYGGGVRSGQLRAFIADLIEVGRSHGVVGMTGEATDALAAFRRFNYENIYLRPASVAAADSVVAILSALVEYYADRPGTLPDDIVGRDTPSGRPPAAGSSDALRAAVRWVGGMTDRYACAQALGQLGWDPAKLPTGIDTPGAR
ncbi:MAG: HD domain-containing protein [Microthrixaceae bacterium]